MKSEANTESAIDRCAVVHQLKTNFLYQTGTVRASSILF